MPLISRVMWLDVLFFMLCLIMSIGMTICLWVSIVRLVPPWWERLCILWLLEVKLFGFLVTIGKKNLCLLSGIFYYICMEEKGEYHNIAGHVSRREPSQREYQRICLCAISNRSLCLSEAWGYFSWWAQKQKCQVEMFIPGLLIFALG